jgi:hypothetical protein
VAGAGAGAGARAGAAAAQGAPEKVGGVGVKSGGGGNGGGGAGGVKNKPPTLVPSLSQQTAAVVIAAAALVPNESDTHERMDIFEHVDGSKVYEGLFPLHEAPDGRKYMLYRWRPTLVVGLYSC